MDVVEAERFAHRVEFVDPQVVCVEIVLLMRDLRRPAADLVVEDDLPAVEVGHVAVVQQVVVRVSGAAVQNEQRRFLRRALPVDLVVGFEPRVVHVSRRHLRHCRNLPSFGPHPKRKNEHARLYARTCRLASRLGAFAKSALCAKSAAIEQ